MTFSLSGLLVSSPRNEKVFWRSRRGDDPCVHAWVSSDFVQVPCQCCRMLITQLFISAEF